MTTVAVPRESERAANTSGRGRRMLLVFAAFASLYASFRLFMLGVWGNDFLEQGWRTSTDVPLAFVWACCMLAPMAWSVSRHTGRISDLLLTVQLATPIVPMLVLFAERGVAVGYMATVTAAYLLLVAVVRMPPLRINTTMLWGLVPRVSLRRLAVAGVALAALYVALAIASGGISTFNLNPFRVYEFRRAAASGQGLLASYLLTNLAAIGIPFSMAVSLERRNYAAVTAVVFLTIIIAGFSNHKSHLAIPLFVYAFYKFFSSPRPAELFLKLVIGLGAAISILYLVAPAQEVLGTWTVRRGFFVPAYANFLYHDFFGVAGNPLVYWADSSVSLGLVESPYALPVPQVIANVYIGLPADLARENFSNAVTGWVGTGYANLGAIGVLLYAGLLGLFMRAADRLAENVGPRVAGASVSMAFFVAFTSSDLPTAVVSHGLGALLILVAMTRFLDWGPESTDNDLLARGAQSDS